MIGGKKAAMAALPTALGDVSPANTTARTVASEARMYDANAHFWASEIFISF